MGRIVYPKPRAAFTLVELMIVIIVIAILASITVVAYSNIKDRATDTVMTSTAKNLQKGIQMKQASDGSVLFDSTPVSRSDILSGYNVRELEGKLDIIYLDSSGCLSGLSDSCELGSEEDLNKNKVTLIIDSGNEGRVITFHWSNQEQKYHSWVMYPSGETIDGAPMDEEHSADI